ncbi:MAG TPA: hypothetical protein VMA09_08465 [Candidatus Binataceae bacterium]|nr:hypothetical protein [Candidatus Binataceae bacterium]
MKYISGLLVGTAMLAMTGAAFAQGTSVVQNGNTEIVFESAGKADLNIPQLKAFDDFAASHADVVSRLARQPRLMDNQQFMSGHPEFAQFVDSHPNFKDEFEANPGNYVHLAPGVERKVEHTSY